MNTRLTAVFALAAVLATGCSQPGTEGLKAEIVAADKAFCEASKKEGIAAAFLGVITADGKLLSDSHLGPDAVRINFMQLPPTATLTWEPSFVDVSSAGDLGYTWGRYTLTLPSVTKGGAPSIHMGTYVTIWKRQPGGAWKVVLDGGNPDRG
jgi:ketosteroid isomerase-like protein